MQIAIVVYPGLTALDAVGPYEVLRLLPDAEVRFVWHATGPIATDSGFAILPTHDFASAPQAAARRSATIWRSATLVR